MRARWPLFVVSLCLAAVAALPSAAKAEDPPFVNYTPFLPPMPGTYLPSSGDECRSGKVSCVDKVIREMNRRFAPMARNCDHDAMFALTYLRTTEEYKRATTTPGFFIDAPFVNHEDAVFAGYYFRPQDAWQAGRLSEVPQAWKLAFTAYDQRKLTGVGDMLMGINAHINRDLPYVLEAIGLVAPDGSSRKPDHDKVNEFLNRVTVPLYAELERRFDPTVGDSDLPGTLDEMATFQAFPLMRENAWRNAERLVATRNNPLLRAVVETSIETTAATTAQAIIAATTASASQRTARDSYCAAHHDDV